MEKYYNSRSNHHTNQVKNDADQMSSVWSLLLHKRNIAWNTDPSTIPQSANFLPSSIIWPWRRSHWLFAGMPSFSSIIAFTALTVTLSSTSNSWVWPLIISTVIFIATTCQQAWCNLNNLLTPTHLNTRFNSRCIMIVMCSVHLWWTCTLT